ncbi:2-amino-3,7-dideoxy-D-threo-hept-6-ulosonate synthase [Bradyrhizobium elkanii]|uniref:2-amino-3,7-dideoxy-D-threo-hept-6-ulosonate synthase n=1 Tax=Bradyrhizobium elkanii TaxID=29448 RepID=UPI001BAE1FEF|nr:2-amino-3,7-dideoxy-D-threo-hept-6-ulosonate synthase [Bradyrhizobium elkanii]MBR1158090.1 2-amino-4,5-dihydroxy-6-one-heptanoic acid-7-phosphate synthase [Bradyrhizobium elkanii]
MTQSGRARRLQRILKSGHSPLFVVPLDHTVTDGPFTSARGYDELTIALVENGVDALVVHKGRIGLLPNAVYEKACVFVHLSASTKYAADPTCKVQVGEVEDCVRRGADAISVHVNIGSLTESQQLRTLGAVADSCERLGVPLLAMMYPRGPGLKGSSSSETLLHAASLAVDLGADVVKLPLGGSSHDMQQVIESCPIPVLAAGGAQVPDDEFATFVANVMKSGAQGLAAGRNIFMAPHPAAKVREVRRILQANYGAAQQASKVRLAGTLPSSYNGPPFAHAVDDPYAMSRENLP